MTLPSAGRAAAAGRTCVPVLKLSAIAFFLFLFTLPAIAREISDFSGTERFALTVVSTELQSRGSERISAEFGDVLARLVDERQPQVGLLPATWELQTASDPNFAVFRLIYPSGIDEWVTFEIRDRKRGIARALYGIGTPAAARVRAGGARSAQLPETGFFRVSRVVLWAACLCLGAAGLYFLGRRRGMAVVLLILAAGAGVAIRMAKPSDADETQRGPKMARSQQEIEEEGDAIRSREAEELRVTRATSAAKEHRDQELRRLRDSFTFALTDPDAIIAEQEQSGFLKDSLLRQEVELLRAHADVARMRLDRAEALLARTPRPWPAAYQLLAARAATIRGREVDALAAYDSFRAAFPENDGTLLEAAEAALNLGNVDSAEVYLRRADTIGSRNARTYYLLAQIAASKGRLEEADAHFLKAWTTEPLERAEALATPGFASLLQRPNVASLLQLSERQILVKRAQNDDPNRCAAHTYFGGNSAVNIGRRLEQQYSRGKIVLHGGTCLSGQTNSRRAEEVHHDDDLSLLTTAQSWVKPSAIPGPAHTAGGPYERILTSLANQGDWGLVADLTEAIPAKADGVSVTALMLRCIALRRTDRVEDSHRLLVEIAASPALKVTRIPDVMRGFAELFATAGFLDAAVKLLERAAAIQPAQAIDDRILQLRTDQRLANAYEVVETEHFRVHFPAGAPRIAAERAATVLEREYARLSKLFPHIPFVPIVVNLVPRVEFRSIYTGNDNILGLYTGKILVPFDGETVTPAAEETLTHELCHALLAQATRDNAPRWFQEGLAQAAEKKAFAVNAYRAIPKGRLLDDDLVEVAFDSVDPTVVEGAYLQAETMIYMMVRRDIPGAVQRFASELRVGLPTAQALHSALGRSDGVGARDWAPAQPEVLPGL